jgi:hypothetical protein
MTEKRRCLALKTALVFRSQWRINIPVQVDVVITVGFSFQLNATFGFDASGVHGLIADGFSGLANANNWGTLRAYLKLW